MYEDSQADLRIDGSGRASGGSYNCVRINGSGKVTGDLVCNEFIINGSGEVNGDVESGKFRINGSGTVRGNLKAEELKVNGSCNFDASVTCESIMISGSSDIRQNLDAQQVKINGSLKIDGDCNAEQFVSKGMFEIGGLLNADNVDVHLYWHKSRVREIGGETITVRLGSNRFGMLRSILPLSFHKPGLETNTIEGDEIYLENTTAKVVRGNNVTIGAGCDIGLVEYKGIYQKTGDAKVEQEIKA